MLFDLADVKLSFEVHSNEMDDVDDACGCGLIVNIVGGCLRGNAGSDNVAFVLVQFAAHENTQSPNISMFFVSHSHTHTTILPDFQLARDRRTQFYCVNFVLRK